jgi:hypothetical protein
MYYKRLIALLIVSAYLILPLDSFANLEPIFASPLQSESSIQQLSSTGQSDSHCPCTDRHGSDGCNSGCSCCSCSSFFAPLPAMIAWRAFQPVTSFSLLEPFQRFPEVYPTIFVPPQNRS